MTYLYHQEALSTLRTRLQTHVRPADPLKAIANLNIQNDQKDLYSRPLDINTSMHRMFSFVEHIIELNDSLIQIMNSPVKFKYLNIEDKKTILITNIN